MANVRLQAKFDTAAAWANLAQSYRTMAGMVHTTQSRDRLLRMAQKLENRSRKKSGTPAAEEN